MTALYDTHDDIGPAFTLGKASIETGKSLEPFDFTASLRADSEEEEVQFQGQPIGMVGDSASDRNKFCNRFNMKVPLSILFLIGALSLAYHVF